MKTITIDIDTTDILGEVSKICSFVGGKEYRDDVPLYDSIRVTDQDKPLLTEFIKSAKRILLSKFTEFSQSTGAGIILTLPVEACPDTNSVKEEAKRFVVHFTTAKWFDIVAKNRVDEYREYATTNLATLERDIYTRCNPVKGGTWTLDNIF